MSRDNSGAVDVPSGIGRVFLAEAREQLAASRLLIAHCVAQLSDEQVWHRDRDDLNSIGNLLLHLAGNLTQRFTSNIGGAADQRDRLREFTERTAVPKVELMRRFDESVAQAEALLSAFDPAKLNDPRPYTTLAGPAEISVQAVIFRTLIHLNGHAQEIVYMTRLVLGGGYQFRSPAGVPKRPTT